MRDDVTGRLFADAHLETPASPASPDGPRPRSAADRTARLFLLLVLLSAALSLPLALRGGWVAGLLLAGCAAALSASAVHGYRRGRTPVALDVADTAALSVMSVLAPHPAAVFGVLFAVVWFRSLTTPAWRGIARGLLFCAGPLTAWVVASSVPWAPTPSAVLGPALATLAPTTVLTTLIGRHLGAVSRGADRSERQASALAALGAGLAGVTEPSVIRRRAWLAIGEICAATPALRVLAVRPADGYLRVVAAAGGPDVVAMLPAGVIAPAATGPGDPGRHVADGAALARATGPGLAWVVVELPHETDGACLLVGGPSRVPASGLAAVRGVVHVVTFALEGCAAHRELTVQARTDALTGLLNRSAFTVAVAAAAAGDAPVALLYVDLDGFKAINDRLGHRAGDQVLVETAARLHEATRPDGICARLGGDEFAVLLQGDSATAAPVAERVAAALALPVRVGDRPAAISASVGLATGAPGTPVDELLHEADVAMYATKARRRTGRARDDAA
jgi:diguanylate cyclase (GGDEF)-like protein